MNDLILLAMERAVKSFGGTDKVFNACGFSNALTKLANINGVIDGEIVRVILSGRSDVKVLSGGYYKLLY